jgi:lysophospholipase L1-like esterase
VSFWKTGYAEIILQVPASGGSISAGPEAINLPTNLTLRILPLGDSITYGIGSPSLNSYRAYLYTKLTSAGAKVSYIGSQKSGTPPNNNNEGCSGYTISQISTQADKSLPQNPNIVTLLAGTNDHIRGSPDAAPERLAALILKITTRVPTVVVLVGTLPLLAPTGIFASAATARPIDKFNKQVPIIAKAAVDRGEKVLAVDMSDILATDLADGIHPNDVGYEKMATAWFKGIEDAASRGWIKNPIS